MTGERIPMARAVGFIGLGRMGSRMAMSLLRAGFSLTVYDRDRDRAVPLADAGAAVAASPADVAGGSDVVITMVTDSAAVEAIVLGESGLLTSLRPGAVLIDMSTIDPAFRGGWRRRFMRAAPHARRTGLRKHGAGGAGPVEHHRRRRSRVCESVQDVLLKIGSRITYAGPNGAGASLKLAVNIVGGLTMQALAESIVLAERAGVPPA